MEADAGGAHLEGLLGNHLPQSRHRTDVPCLLMFLAFLCGMVYIYFVSRMEGNLAKLTHGFNWKGEICGVDAAVRHEPNLFWCNPSADQDSVVLLDGVCVASCPNNATTQHWCPGAAQPLLAAACHASISAA